MSDDISWRARYDFTCGAGQWKNSSSYNTTQLPDRPEGISHLKNSSPICHDEHPEFKVNNPISGLTYDWNTVPNNSSLQLNLGTDEVTVSSPSSWSSYT